MLVSYTQRLSKQRPISTVTSVTATKAMPRLAFTAVSPPLYALRASRPPRKSRPAVMSSPPGRTEERFDVLHSDGTPAGFSKPRSQVHRDGDWHRSTHVWVLATDGRLLIQKRSALKDTFPGRWDVSAAGHISAGDSSLESAQRELYEELGVRMGDGEELKLVATEKASVTGSTERYGAFKDNEVQDVYVYRPKSTLSLEELALQEEEVADVVYCGWRDYRDRLMEGSEELVPRSAGYFQSFFPWLEKEIG